MEELSLRKMHYYYYYAKAARSVCADVVVNHIQSRVLLLLTMPDDVMNIATAVAAIIVVAIVGCKSGYDNAPGKLLSVSD